MMSKKLVAMTVAFFISFLSVPVCAMQESGKFEHIRISPSSEVSDSTPRTEASLSDTPSGSKSVTWNDTQLTQEYIMPADINTSNEVWSDEEGVVPFAPGKNSWGSAATRKPVWGQASQQGAQKKPQHVRAEASLGFPGEEKVSLSLAKIQAQALGEIERDQAAIMLAKAVAKIQRDQANSGFSERK